MCRDILSAIKQFSHKVVNWMQDDSIDKKLFRRESTIEDPATGVLLNLDEQKVIVIRARLLFERDKMITPMGGKTRPTFFTTLERNFAVNELVKDGRECKHRYLFIENLELYDKDGKTPLEAPPFQGYEVLVGKNMADLAVKTNGGEKQNEN